MGELLPDLYKYSERLKRKLQSIKDSKEISKHNTDKIIEFQRSCLANGISKARMLRYLNDLPVIAKKIDKNFEKLKKPDIEKIMAEIGVERNLTFNKNKIKLRHKKKKIEI